MTFTIANWGRVSTSTNEPTQSVTPGGGAAVTWGSPRSYAYWTLDTQNTVATTANYFCPAANNSVANDLAVGDDIRVYSATDLTSVSYLVTAVSPTTPSVTISASNGGLLTANVSVTTAQMLAGIYTTSVAIIPAPGANRMIIPVNATIELVFNSIAYAAGGVVLLQYGSTANGGGTNAFGTTMTAAHMNNGASAVQGFAGVAQAWATNATYANLGIYIGAQTQDFTTGNSNVQVTINYRVVTLL
jgi:hypothetical protein